MDNVTRVKKHRTKMVAEECSRLEVTLGTWLVDETQEAARRSRLPVWKVVESALIEYLKRQLPETSGQ